MRRTRIPSSCCALIVSGAIATPVAAQSLAEVAREEKQRRARLRHEAAKTFTDDDLAAAAAERPPSERDAEKEPQRSTREEDEEWERARDEERADRARLEREWRARFAEARERLAAAEAASWRTVIRTEFYKGVPVQMKVREQVETQALIDARENLEQLRTELRRSGLPPGWAR